MVTAPERCDPAASGSLGCCNPESCLPFSAGRSCGLELDECGAPTCTGAGQCVTKPAFVGLRCREAGSIGPCDPGAFCGVEPYCPSDDTATGCEAMTFVLARANVSFRCKAHRSSQGPVKCGADFFGALEPRSAAVASGAPRAPRRQRLAFDALPASDCSGAQFDTAVPKKLQAVSRAELSRVIVRRINQEDRAFFAPGRSVCVRVRFTTGTGYSQTRLYTVTVPAR